MKINISFLLGCMIVFGEELKTAVTNTKEIKICSLLSKAQEIWSQDT